MIIPPLIGMVHLAPLPGSPRHAGSMDRVLEQAITDATILTDAGFDALMVENFGDAPFFPDDVPDLTVAAMTRVITELKTAIGVPLGVNVLRNDALAAAAIAMATGARMIRVNVLSGTMHTDQGPIVGRAAELARTLMLAAHPPLVLADVFVKHATPPAGLSLEQAASDLWERGGASALVVSGSGTGAAVDLQDAKRIHTAVPEAPLVVGSGATTGNIAALREATDAVIVGSSLKRSLEDPIDPDLAGEFVHAARGAGFTA